MLKIRGDIRSASDPSEIQATSSSYPAYRRTRRNFCTRSRHRRVESKLRTRVTVIQAQIRTTGIFGPRVQWTRINSMQMPTNSWLIRTQDDF
tara:strand:- start:13953 stop:14228 length:276 start_codon:yes stop_codon:yes gene_type:complete